jgi:hypothetical protein
MNILLYVTLSVARFLVPYCVLAMAVERVRRRHAR